MMMWRVSRWGPSVVTRVFPRVRPGAQSRGGGVRMGVESQGATVLPVSVEERA